MDLDSEETERYQRLLREGPGGTARGVDPELIWRAAAGELSRGETDRLLDRSVRDPEVALAWQMAVELQAANDSAAHAGPERLDNLVALDSVRRRTPVQRAAPWALAAGLALALAGSLLLGPQPSLEAPDVLRGTEAVSSAITATSPAVLPRDAFVLSWSEAAGFDAARYRLWLTTDELTPVAEARDLETPEARIEADVFDGLSEGTRLLWRVEAQAGGEVVESDTFVVTLGASSDP